MHARTALSLLSLTLACNHHAPAPAAPPRAEPRAELARLLAEYDRASGGPDRAALARRIDSLAGQRHAAWSRLYWHRDLEQARREARAAGKPILSLRMLGRLDEDLSCANSRFFRVALYANREVSRYLADHFILHWSSERPVPVARIDFGDGRVLERTVAGNSAHYVLDAGGRPVDVIPGLYSPALFLDALEQARPVAAAAGALGDRAFAAQVIAYHRDQTDRAARRFASLGRVRVAPAGASLMDAEMRAASKAAVERPLVEALQLGTQIDLARARSWDRASDFWAQVGAAMDRRVAPGRLDRQSRALMSALEPADWARAGQPLPAAGLERLAATFESVMRRDAAYNELVLHQQIHQHMGSAPGVDLAALNRWVYAALFLTPAEDPWLGMATPDVFTALPRDGIAAAL